MVMTPIQTMQNNLTIWNELLQASVGELNPSKCIWFCFHWKLDACDMAKIIAPPAHVQPLQISTELNHSVPIWQLQPQEAHCYLGVQFTMDGNCREELSLFQQCNSKFIKLLQQCPFPHWDIQVIYKQYYLLTVSYPLPATTMPPDQLYKLQGPATSIFLTKMRYPWTFPWAITYAASDQGGLDFCHLGHKQGMQKCLQLLKHIHTKTTIGKVYQVTHGHYQLMSGLSHPILKDTHPIPWSTVCWVDQLHKFLHTIQGSILLDNLWHPPPCCTHDHFIMEDVLNVAVPKWQALQIQHVWLFLKVTTLSNIVDHQGTNIIPVMLHLVPVAQHA